ncbi:hypothetical protein BD309DRAFT_956283 [Dichomitus squalens]|nr:hypothetical protein BD309DRAFT_956283 [Dichomitus squalens]
MKTRWMLNLTIVWDFRFVRKDCWTLKQGGVRDVGGSPAHSTGRVHRGYVKMPDNRDGLHQACSHVDGIKTDNERHKDMHHETWRRPC